MMDMVMDNLPLVGGGLGALVLGGLGIVAMRRRRARVQDDLEAQPVAPTFEDSAAGDAGMAASAAVATATEAAAPTSEDVDPVAEAEVYIAYGRDGQAEEILKEAMGRDPSRADVQVKLAEVYAGRKDVAAFGTLAESVNALTGGAGDQWIKVAALGYALDPENPLYAAGKDVAPAAGTGDATATDLDFDLGGDGAGTTPDIALDGDPAGQATELGGTQGMADAADAGVVPEPAMPDFNLDTTSAGGADAASAPELPAAGEASSIDFNIELPPIDTPEPAAGKPAEAAPATDSGLDFKIDVGDLNINLDEPSTTAIPAAGKDSHWYDVQQKFDLAKAYQEMGDNDGAREILQEVLKEGDAEQQDQAHKLLGSLG